MNPNGLAGSARKRRRLVVPTTLVLVALSGPAFAVWSIYGSGDGTGGTRGTAALTLSSATPGAGLYPGGVSAVAVRITNPNDASVEISSLELNGNDGTSGFTVDADHVGCTAASLAFVPQSNAGTGWTVPGRAGGTDGVLTVSLPESLSMSLDAPNACQGAVVTIHLRSGN